MGVVLLGKMDVHLPSLPEVREVDGVRMSVKGRVFALTLDCCAVGQALPGILGRDGRLATHIPLLRGIPGLASLPRVMIHFNWNVGEMTFLLLAARAGLPRLLSPPLRKDTRLHD